MFVLSGKKYLKLVSYVACFSILFPPTFVSVNAFTLFGKTEKSIPVSSKTQIVSLLVEEDLLGYAGVKRKIERYAQDVQKAVNAQVVMVSVPKETSVKEIYEGNAALYFSGLEGDEQSQLIGTVVIGDVPLPVVSQNGRPYISSWPYSDFENSEYIWNNENQQFEYIGGDRNPEIWQGLIRPTVEITNEEAALEKRAELLEEYFEKNNAFHKGQIQYGKRVFHANLPFQKDGISDLMRQSYESYIKNIEDIKYGRFTKELAQELFEDQKIDELVDLDLIEGVSADQPKMDFGSMPDVFSKNVIEKLQRKYIELYQGYLSQLNTKVEQSGRWDAKTVDTTFSLITKKDEVAANLLKKFNDAVERKMFATLAGSNIPADISLPKGGTVRESDCTFGGSGMDYFSGRNEGNGCTFGVGFIGSAEYLYFPEYWNGIKIDLSSAEEADLIANNKIILDFDAKIPTFDSSIASQCSLLRGSGINGKTVEFNHTFSFENINTAQTTNEYFCDADDLVRACGQIINNQLQTSQANFSDVSNFSYDLNARKWSYIEPRINDRANTENFYKFYTEQSPLLDLTAGKVRTDTNVGASGCADIIWEKNKDNIPDNDNVHNEIETNLQTFSSLVNHIEPTVLTIKEQFSKISTSPAFDLPVDNPRGVSFYDSEFDFQQVSYPNIFALRNTALTEEARETILENELLAILENKAVEINALSVADNNVSDDFLTEVLEDFDVSALVEALIWLDAPIESKNQTVFLAALKKPNITQKELSDTSFSGFEVLQLFAEADLSTDQEGIQVDFERLPIEDSFVFTQAEIEDLSFQYQSNNSNSSVFSQLFADSGLNSQSSSNTQNDTNTNCNRNLLTWSASCLVPWLSDLPNAFGKFSKLIATDAENISTESITVVPNDSLTTTDNQNAVAKISTPTKKIILNTANIVPQKITIELLDQDNEILKSDFSSTVTLSLPKELQINGDLQKTVQNGRVNFFFTPQKDIAVGTYNIVAQTNNGKNLTIPFVVTNQSLESSITFSRLEAGDSEGTIITVRATKESNITSQHDGTELEFFSDLGKFSDNGKAVFKNGKAQIQFFPGTQSGQTKISVFHPQMATDFLSVEIYPAPLSQVLYDLDSSFLVQNSVRKKNITAFLADRFGNKIESQADPKFEWKVNGLEKENVSVDSIAISLSNENTEDVWVLADTDLLEQKSVPKKITVVKNPLLKIKEYSDTFEAGNAEKQSVFFETQTSDGKILPASFVAGIETEIEESGFFPTTVNIENGVGEIEFFAGVKTGTYTVKILVDGFAPAVFQFEIRPANAQKIEINKDKTVRSAKVEKEIIEISVRDAFGNIATTFNEKLYARLNPVDTESEYITPEWLETENPIELIELEDETNFYGIPVDISNGVGTLGIFPKEISGQLSLIVQKQNLVPATAVFDFSNVLIPKDFNFLQPQSLLTILRGWKSFAFEEKNITNEFLFNGNSQAVLASVVQKNPERMIGWIHPNGRTSETILAQLKEGAVPKIELFDSENKIANVLIEFESEPEIRIEKNTDSFTTEGVYIQVPEAERNNFEFKQYQLWYKKIPLLVFRKNGGVNILNPNINFSQTDLWNKFLVSTDENVPEFLVQFIGSDTLKNSIETDFLIAEEQTLSQSNEIPGILILDRSKEETAQRKLPSKSTDESDIDWVGEQKIATLFGAQNTAGKSWQFSASPDAFLFGDPTVAVATKNPVSTLKLTKDLGNPLWKNPTGTAIEQVLAGDLNLDGKKEIFSLSDTVLSVQYADPNEEDIYRAAGPILRFADGVKKLAIYDNISAQIEYLIQINEAGELVFFENKTGVLSRTASPIAFKKVWVDIQVGNLNRDNFLDLVLLDEENTLYVVHGKGDGSFHSPTKLYSFWSEINVAQESFSPTTFNADNPEENTHEYLSSFYVSFAKTGQTDFGDTNILDTSFASLTTNKSIRFDFDLTPTAKSQIGGTVKAELELMPLQAVNKVQIVVPNIEGMILDENSFACTSCNGELDPTATSYGTLLKNISGLVGRKQTITWEYKIVQIPQIEFVVDDFFGKDKIDDVVVPWSDPIGKRQFVLFQSDGVTPQYPTTVLPTVQFSFFKKINNFLKAQSVESEAARTKTHTLTFKSAVSNNDYSDLSTQDLKDLSQNAFDSIADLGFEEDSIDSILSQMACGSGACGLQIPSYVFMGPGQQSLYLPPISLPSIPTLPIPQVGLPALQIVPFIPFVLPFTPTVPASTFRLFVMPSITGQVGIAACLGLQATSSIAPLPVGNCFTFVPPINVFGSCELDDTDTALAALESAFNFANTGTYTPPTIKETKNKKLISADIITAWVQAQFEEFSNFKFPSINFILPKFSSAQKNESASVWEKLNKSDFLKVNRNVIDISYPSFSDKELSATKKAWSEWKKNNKQTGKNASKETLKKNKNFEEKIAQSLSVLQLKTSVNLMKETMKSLSLQREGQVQIVSQIDQKKIDTLLLKDIEALEKDLENLKNQVVTAAETDEKILLDFNESKRFMSDLKEKISTESETSTTEKSAFKREQLSKEKLENKLILLASTENIARENNRSTAPRKTDTRASDTKKLLKEFSQEILDLTYSNGVENRIVTVDKNIKTIENYKKNEVFLKSIQQKVEKIAAQIETITSLINSYFSEWKKANERKGKEWEIFRAQLEVTLKAWKSIPEVFSGLTKKCPTCNVNRGTVISWFLKVILGSIKLPVIPLPKSPNITIDLSKAGIGLTLDVPKIQLKKTDLKLSNVVKTLPNLDADALTVSIIPLLEKEIAGLEIDMSGNGNKLATGIMAKALAKIAKEKKDASKKNSENKSTVKTEEESSENKKELNTDTEEKSDADNNKEVENKSTVKTEEESSENKKELNTDAEEKSDAENSSFNDVSSKAFDEVLKLIPIEKLNILPEIPLLPSTPDFSRIPFDLSIPSVDLPQLPLILSPPVLPNFLAPLQQILAIPKPFFNLFCYLILGIIPVPEWKLASHIQEKTNRTTLLPALDFVAGALLKSPKKPDLPNMKISFEGVYPPALEPLNIQLEQLAFISNCLVQTLVGGECQAQTRNIQSVAISKKTETMASTLETVVFDGKTSESNFQIERHHKIIEKKLLAQAQKSTQTIQENTQKLLAAVSTPDKKNIPSNLLASTELLSSESVRENLADVPAFVAPTISYFESQKNRSESIFSYNLIGKNYTSLTVDLERDGAEEILYTIEDELFVKRRVSNAVSNSTLKNPIKLDIEDFVELFVPTQTLSTNTYANGADVELSVFDPATKYYEWNLSDRPDVLWEVSKKPENRMSEEWNRVGMLIRSDIQKYQVRPSSAQIVSVTGEPKLTAPQKQTVPIFEERAACTDANIEKPFFATETLLLGTKNNTTFRIETKQRKGEAPKSFWKRINEGEEILVDFAEVCVISGGIETISYEDETTFTPQAGDYFPNNALIETDKDSSVSLLIDGVYEIEVSHGETYEIETFTDEIDFVSGFKSLSVGNNYGVVTALNEQNRSAVWHKLLHDPQGADDTEDPTIVLQKGTQIEAPLFAPIIIDATDSFDNVGLKEIIWESEKFDFSTQKTLTLTIPAQTKPAIFEVLLTILDTNNNQSQKNITVSVEGSTADIIKATTTEVFVTAENDVPLNLFRDRKGKVTNILQNFSLNKNKEFSFTPKNESKTIEIWQNSPQKKLAEIFATGRILVTDADTEIKINPATKKNPVNIVLQKKDQTQIATLEVSFDKKIIISDTDTKADVFVSDVLSTDNLEWQFFNSSVVGFKNAVALVDTTANKTIFIIDASGNFYNLSAAFSVHMASGKETAPLEFVLKDLQQQSVARFSFSNFDIAVQ